MRKLLTFLIVLAALMVGCTKDQNGVEQITFPGFPTGEVSLHPGESVQVQYSILPVSAQLTTAVEWSSSDPTVASVMNGTITGNQMGRATITATAGGVSASLNVVVVEYDIESFKINKSSIEMKIDTEETITISSIVPVEASPYNIVWEAVPEGVISYYIEDYTIHISTISCGKTTLTGYVSSGFKQSCEIEVLSTDVARVEVTPADKEVFEGYSTTLTAQIIPDFALDKKLTWSVSPSGIGTITPNSSTLGATFKAKNEGTATITAKSANGVEGSCTIKVNSTDVTSITLKASNSSIREYSSGTITITSTVLPEITPDKKLTWSVSNSSYGTITPSADGTSATFTPKAAGKVTVTATANNGVKSTVQLTVNAFDSSNIYITLDSKTVNATTKELSPNNSFGVSAKTLKLGVRSSDDATGTDLHNVLPSGRITWKSLYSNIASVDSKGNVTAKGHGVTKITVTIDGKYSASMYIASYDSAKVNPVVSCFHPKFQYSSDRKTTSIDDFAYFVPYSPMPFYVYDLEAIHLDTYMVYHDIFAQRVSKYLTIKPKSASDYKNNWSSAITPNSNLQCFVPTVHSITGWGKDKKNVAKSVIITCTETGKTWEKTVYYNLAGVIIHTSTSSSKYYEMPINYSNDSSTPSTNKTTAAVAKTFVKAYYVPILGYADWWNHGSTNSNLEVMKYWEDDYGIMSGQVFVVDGNGTWKYEAQASHETAEMICTQNDGDRFPGRTLYIFADIPKG